MTHITKDVQERIKNVVEELRGNTPGSMAANKSMSDLPLSLYVGFTILDQVLINALTSLLPSIEPPKKTSRNTRIKTGRKRKDGLNK